MSGSRIYPRSLFNKALTRTKKGLDLYNRHVRYGLIIPKHALIDYIVAMMSYNGTHYRKEMFGLMMDWVIAGYPLKELYNLIPASFDVNAMWLDQVSHNESTVDGSNYRRQFYLYNLSTDPTIRHRQLFEELRYEITSNIWQEIHA